MRLNATRQKTCFFYRIVILIVLCGATELVYATPFIFNSATDGVFVGNHITYKKISSNDSLHIADLNGFVKSETDVLNFGVTENTYLIHFELINQSDKSELYFECGLSSFEVFEVYQLRQDSLLLIGEYGVNCESHGELATAISFPIIISKGEKINLLIKVRSNLGIALPIKIHSPKNYLKTHALENIFGGIYFGAIITMLLYNLFLYLQIKDKNYLYYVVYVTFLLLYLASFKGYAPMYIWHSSDWLRANATFIFCCLSVVFGLQFGSSFLNLRKYLPKFVLGIRVFQVITLMNLGVYFFYSKQLGFNLFYMLTLLTMFFLSFLAVWVFKKGHRIAKYYIIGQFVFFLSIFFTILRIYSLIPHNFFTTHLSEMGTMFDVTIFSFALASRINIMKQEKELTKLKMLESDKKYHEVLEHQNRNLEKEVKKQLLEIEMANKELKRQTLSAQINPHFIFNVLNSIQSYLLQEKYSLAETYLSKFSKLIRFYLQSSFKKFVVLREEVDAINSYLNIERMRTDNRFDFKIHISDDIDINHFEIPSLVILPFLENAVWHGVLNKEGQGLIKIQLLKSDSIIDVTIIDDGVGIEYAKKHHKKSSGNSVGIHITEQKIKLLNEIYNSDYKFSITDLGVVSKGRIHGTEVNFTIPFQENWPDYE